MRPDAPSSQPVKSLIIEILRETPSFRAGRKGGGPCGATAEPSGGVEAPAFRPGRTSTTEKPSMGRDVAAALGVTTRRDGYLEGTHDLVTWCVGHLVEL